MVFIYSLFSVTLASRVSERGGDELCITTAMLRWVNTTLFYRMENEDTEG